MAFEEHRTKSEFIGDTTDRMICAWAEKKYGIETVTSVEFIFDEGWTGTDITPGDPAEFRIEVHGAYGERKYDEGLEYVPSLIREIAAFATGRVDG